MFKHPERLNPETILRSIEDFRSSLNLLKRASQSTYDLVDDTYNSCKEYAAQTTALEIEYELVRAKATLAMAIGKIILSKRTGEDTGRDSEIFSEFSNACERICYFSKIQEQDRLITVLRAALATHNIPEPKLETVNE